MKTNRILFLFAAAAMLCSCAKELATDETYSQNGEGQLTLNVNLDQVKTALGVKDGTTYPQTWSAGDFLVLNGVASSPLAEGGSKGASFVFQGTFQPPYNVVYCGKADAADVVVFPAKQTYVAGTFAPFTAPLYGSGSNVNEITMQPINSALRIPLTGEATISKIVVEALGGEKISGEFTLGKTSNVYDGTFTPAETAGSLATLDCGDGVTLSQEETPFFVTLPSGTYTEGLRIYAVSSDKKAMVLKLGSLTTIAAGKVYELPVKDFAAGDTYVIAEPADMDVLPTLIDAAGVGKTVILIDDIDMTGKTWTSFGSGGDVTNSGNFTATLDGQGHTISGLTTPLFGNLCGSVRNLTVEAVVSYTSGMSSYKGSGFGIGILAGYVVNSLPQTKGTVVVENVITKGSITVGGNINNGFNLGGLLGCNDGAKIQNCVNEASLTMVDKTVNGYLYCGGVMGNTQQHKYSDYNANPIVTKVVNKGDITVSVNAGTNVIYTGGVVGRLAANNLSTMDKCENHGTLDFACQSANENYYAGLIGYDGSGAEVKDCLNAGDVYIACHSGGNAKGNHAAGVISYVLAKKITNVKNTGNVVIKDGFSFAWCTVSCVLGRIKTNATVTMDNVVNEGNLVFEAPVLSETTSYARTGGLIGQCDGNPELIIKNCRNAGDITFNNGKTAVKTVISGGIGGNIKTTKLTVTGTSNSGNITFNGSVVKGQFLQIGGLFGRVEKNASPSSASITGVAGTPTNSGKLTLYDETTLCGKPYAGGIAGYFGDTNMNLTLTDCSNVGAIGRKVNNYTYDASTYAEGDFNHYAGGIAGYTNAIATLTNCSNSAEIQFSKNNGTATPFGNKSQVAGYSGGIIGNGGGKDASNLTKLVNCNNSGNIPSVEGYAGGICGYVWSMTIEGTGGKYCTNTGDIVYRGNPSIRPQTTAGGIVGGGSTNNTLSMCYNTGATAGNGGTSGLIGRINVKDNQFTINNCKSFSIVCGTSNWAKTGAIIGFTCGQEDPMTLLAKAKNVAVGGKICYGITDVSKFIDLNADNYLSNLYYNKEKAVAGAQTDTPACAVMTPEQAATLGIVYWDGTSALPWEN